MNFRENVREGLRSVRSNLLRSILTALIIAIGIMSLVGILTAVDSIQASVDDSFADLGANSFDIEIPDRRGHGPGRRSEKTYPPIEYRQAMEYEEKYKFPAKVSISAFVSGATEIKYLSKKTNPNISIIGMNENYLLAKGIDLEKGRNFSNFEQKQGAYVAIIGNELVETLFDKKDPINEGITIRGARYKVVGTLKKSGSSSKGSTDREILVPLENGRLIAQGGNPTYNITTILNSNLDFDLAMGEATSIMRRIRRDPLGQPESFKISRSETLAEQLESITGYLKAGGGVVGFITLLGASIGLMNIMMVSVTERTREIGIRKALGATPFRIRQQFLVEAVVICQIGGIFGVFVGILIGNGVSRLLGSDTFIIPWVWMITGLVICVIVGIGSGFYPAYKASRLDPIESLRLE